MRPNVVVFDTALSIFPAMHVENRDHDADPFERTPACSSISKDSSLGRDEYWFCVKCGSLKSEWLPKELATHDPTMRGHCRLPT
jgi:hypothetical protein